MFHVSISCVLSNNIQYQMERGRLLTQLSTDYVQTRYQLSLELPYEESTIDLILQLVEDRTSIQTQVSLPLP